MKAASGDGEEDGSIAAANGVVPNGTAEWPPHRYAVFMTTLQNEPDSQLATCPLCHTVGHALGAVALAGYWRCERCGHGWTTLRLATVAAYEAWTATRDVPARGAA